MVIGPRHISKICQKHVQKRHRRGLTPPHAAPDAAPTTPALLPSLAVRLHPQPPSPSAALARSYARQSALPRSPARAATPIFLTKEGSSAPPTCSSAGASILANSRFSVLWPVVATRERCCVCARSSPAGALHPPRSRRALTCSPSCSWRAPQAASCGTRAARGSVAPSHRVSPARGARERPQRGLRPPTGCAWPRPLCARGTGGGAMRRALMRALWAAHGGNGGYPGQD